MAQLRYAAAVLLTAFNLFCMGASAYSHPALPLEDARQFVETVGTRTIELMRHADQLTDDQLKENVAVLVADSVDLDTISRAVVGNAWNTATPLQRQEFRDLYARWTVHLYFQHLCSDTANKIVVVNATVVPNSGDVLVQAFASDAPGVEIGARIRQKSDGQLRIVDLMIRGFSLLMTQRADFTSVISRSGFDGLITDLRGRLGNLRAELR